MIAGNKGAIISPALPPTPAHAKVLPACHMCATASTLFFLLLKAVRVRKLSVSFTSLFFLFIILIFLQLFISLFYALLMLQTGALQTNSRQLGALL